MNTTSKTDLYRLLPSVDDLLRAPELAPLVAREGQPVVADSVRVVLGLLREEINNGRLAGAEAVQIALSGLVEAVAQRLRAAMEFSLKPVINATGVILHTNLGRAPLSQAALRRIGEVAGRYSNLEFDIPAGPRGKPHLHLQPPFSHPFNQHSPSCI